VKRFAFAAALVGAFAIGGTARAEDEVKPMRYPPSSVRLPLIAGGVLVTGAAYGIGFLAATQWSDAPGASQLKIPVAGPWLSLAKNGCNEDSCGATPYIRGVLTFIGGLAQLGGLGLIGEGIFMTTEAPRREAAAPPRRVTVQALPIVTAQTAGVGVLGTF
jgi:hypothetical protein